MMIVFWGLVIGVAIWAIRSSKKSENRVSQGDDPARVLDQRFARGELSEDEYLNARSMLTAHADDTAKS